jgi:hypothetical protein
MLRNVPGEWECRLHSGGSLKLRTSEEFFVKGHYSRLPQTSGAYKCIRNGKTEELLVWVSDKGHTFPFVLHGGSYETACREQWQLQGRSCATDHDCWCKFHWGGSCPNVCATVLYIPTLGQYLPDHCSFRTSQVVSILRWSPGSVSGQFTCYFCVQSRNGAGFSLYVFVSLTDHYSVNVQPSSTKPGKVRAFEVALPRKPTQPTYYYYYYYY